MSAAFSRSRQRGERLNNVTPNKRDSDRVVLFQAILLITKHSSHKYGMLPMCSAILFTA